VRYLYSGGTDFADRPQEESLLYIPDSIGGDSEQYEGDAPISAGEAEDETVRPDKPVITLGQLRPYYQGVFFAKVSMKKKLSRSIHSRTLSVTSFRPSFSTSEHVSGVIMDEKHAGTYSRYAFLASVDTYAFLDGER
jgi:hypothetical protein